MAKVTTTAVPSVQVEVVRGEDGFVDVEAMLYNAEKAVNKYAENDGVATGAVVAATVEVLNNPKYAKEQKFSAATVAKMALAAMGDMPTEKACKDAEVRVAAFLSSQGEKYLHVAAGRHSGFWVRDRLSADDLAKLTKSKVV